MDAPAPSLRRSVLAGPHPRRAVLRAGAGLALATLVPARWGRPVLAAGPDAVALLGWAPAAAAAVLEQIAPKAVWNSTPTLYYTAAASAADKVTFLPDAQAVYNCSFLLPAADNPDAWTTTWYLQIQAFASPAAAAAAQAAAKPTGGTDYSHLVTATWSDGALVRFTRSANGQTDTVTTAPSPKAVATDVDRTWAMWKVFLVLQW